MPQKYSLDEWLSQGATVIRADEWANSGAKKYSIDEWLSGEERTATASKAPEPDYTRTEALGSIAEQLLWGLGESVTMGLLSKPDRVKPKGMAAEIAHEVGRFGGLLLGPAKVVKPFTAAAKGVWGTSKAANVGRYLTEKVGGMALLGAASDITAPPKEMLQNVGEFAIMGGVFAGSSLFKVPGHKVLSQVLQQGGTRALMKVTGMYPEGYLNKENLPHVVWQEALNTFFSLHGVTPREVLTGKYANPAKRRMVDSIQDAANELNYRSSPAEFPGVRIPVTAFMKLKSSKIDLNLVEVDPVRVNLAEKEKLKVRMRAGEKSRIPELWYDDATGTYRTSKDAQGGHNTLLAALRDLQYEAIQRKEKPNFEIDAKVLYGPGRSVSIMTPIQWAMDMLGVSKVDQYVVDRLRFDNVVVMGPEGKSSGKLQGLYGTAEAAKLRVGDYQVVYLQERGGDLAPIFVGKGLKGKFKWKGTTLPDQVTYKNMQDTTDKIANLKAEAQAGSKTAAGRAKILENKLKKLEERFRADAEGDLTFDIPTQPRLKRSTDIVEPWKARNLTEAEKLQSLLNDVERAKASAESVVRQQFEKVGASELVKYAEEAVKEYDVQAAKLKKDIAVLDKGPKATDPAIELVKTLSGGEKPGQKMTFDPEQMTRNAKNTLEQFRKMPGMEVPENYLSTLNTRVAELRFGLVDAEVIYRVAGIEGRPKLKDLRNLENQIFNLATQRVEDRMNWVFTQFHQGRDLYETPLSEKWRKRQDASEVWEKARAKSKLQKAYEEYAADPTKGTPLEQLLTLRFARSWGDVRYAFGHFQQNTGILWHRIYEKLSDGEHRKRAAMDRLLKPLDKYYNKLTTEEQVQIREYYRNLWEARDVDRTRLSKSQNEVIDRLDPLFKSLREPVFDKRFNDYYEHVYRPAQDLVADLPYQTPKLRAKMIEANQKDTPTVFKNQKDAKAREFLDEGAELYERTKAKFAKDYKENVAEFMEWRTEALRRGFGLIEQGSYFPEIFLNPGKARLTRQDTLINIGALTKKPFEIRSDPKLREQLDSLLKLEDEAMKKALGEKDLVQQVSDYVSQVLNQQYLGEGLKTLDELSHILSPALQRAKAISFWKVRKEARTYSTYQYLQQYTMRLKGFPLPKSGIGSALSGIQTVFFRSLTNRPRLVMRNYPQRFVTAVMKKALFMNYGKKYRLENMPERIKEYFGTSVDEMEVVTNFYLDLKTRYKFLKNPILGKLWEITGYTGRMYSLSDFHNRRFVFTKTYHYTKQWIDAFNKGKTDIDTLERKVGIGKMKPYEQYRFRHFMSEGDYEMAAAVVGKYNSVNSQWLYSRTERSFQEMSSEAEAFTNLITFSRSMAQQAISMGSRMQDGYMRSKLAKTKEGRNSARRDMFNAGAQVAGVLLAGAVSNKIMNLASNSSFSKFNDYGPSMFTWNLGGVTLEILTTFTDTLAELVDSVDGTPAERKTAVDAAVKMMDNVGIRQLIPYSKTVLSMIESFTGRSYISPVYDKWQSIMYGYPKNETFVDRTTLEGIIHGVLSSDPAKQEDVRRFVFDKMVDFESALARASNPVSKAYYSERVAMYRYYNDQLQRYTPKQLDGMAEEAARERYWEDMDKKEQLKAYQEMKKQYK